MKVWWVNQLGTYKQELTGNYMWAPISMPYVFHHKNMELLSPGDLVFSHVSGKLIAVGKVLDYAYESLKPKELSNAKLHPKIYWNDTGHRADVNFHDLQKPINVKEVLNLISPYLPSKYSPINVNGFANQGYLFEFPIECALILEKNDYCNLGLASNNESDIISSTIIPNSSSSVTKVEEDELTERIALRKSRLGQGRFRKEVLNRWNSKCSLTSIDMGDILIASHIKPWRDCDNSYEKLDPDNGLLLLANYDAAFDKGYITFNEDGKILISDSFKKYVNQMGIDTSLNLRQGFLDSEKYMRYHRENIFRGE